MRNFDTIQKGIYPLLSDQGMDKNAFLNSLQQEIEEMDDGDGTVFTVLSMRERKHAYNIYLLKKKVHDAWKRRRERLVTLLVHFGMSCRWPKRACTRLTQRR